MPIAQQAPEPSPRPMNFVRRGIGVALGLGPVALLIASIGYGVARGSGGIRGLVFAVAGLLLGILNAHLTFVRPQLYRLRHGSMEGYRNISGLPVLGTVLVVAAGVSGFGELPTGIVGLISLALDTGGLPWFLIWTWRNESLWDA